MAEERMLCPLSHSPLLHLPLRQAEEEHFQGRALRAPTATTYRPLGPTPSVLVRQDGGGAYPVKAGIPVLLAPEMLVPAPDEVSIDISQPQYAEAYEEMAFYTAEGMERLEDVGRSSSGRNLSRIMAAGDRAAACFPEDWVTWIDAKYELAAQLDAYRFLRPAGSTVMQVGGNGLHALKFLLAGARTAWLVSPMIGELRYAKALATHCGVAHRFRCVAAVAEELPFGEAVFDAVYAQGSVHHWVTRLAIPECHRVLKPGGRFAAVEPWRAPLYGLGTGLLGKRQRDIHCVVLTSERVKPFLEEFHRADIEHHWPLSRYALIGLSKLGIKLRKETVWHIGRFDDRIASRWAKLRDTGSSVAIMARKSDVRSLADKEPRQRRPLPGTPEDPCPRDTPRGRPARR